MKLNTLKIALVPLAAALFLGGCSTVSDMFSAEDPALEGERISVLALEQSLKPDAEESSSVSLSLPAEWRNAFWPQSGGYPNHSMQNLELNNDEMKKLWSRDVDGHPFNTLPITASPIVVNDVIYTLDTVSNVTAVDTETGKVLWRKQAANPDEPNPEEDGGIISGGLSFGMGMLFATNGYNEVVAIDPKDGSLRWRQDVGAPSRAAPTVLSGRIYVTTLDNRLTALSAQDGKILWEHAGLNETAGLIGAASAAANHDLVIPVFSSGEVTALRVQNGAVAWSDNLSSLKNFGGVSSLSDINALPIIDNGLVIVMSFSGRLVAIDERSGERVWQRELGGSNTPWVAGDHLFVLTSDHELVGIDRRNGAIHWVTSITADKGNDVFMNGPVLAGGRLILAGTDGQVIEFNPYDGKMIRQWDVGRTIVVPPVVAGGVLYLLDERGHLMAYK